MSSQNQRLNKSDSVYYVVNIANDQKKFRISALITYCWCFCLEWCWAWVNASYKRFFDLVLCKIVHIIMILFGMFEVMSSDESSHFSVDVVNLGFLNFSGLCLLLKLYRISLRFRSEQDCVHILLTVTNWLLTHKKFNFWRFVVHRKNKKKKKDNFSCH